MATKPTKYPEWASSASADKREPSANKKQFGQAFGQNTTRQEINYQWDLFDQWIEHLDQRQAINDVYITADVSKTVVQVEAQMGGTWDFIDGVDGADTLSGQDVIVFKRTA